MKSRDIEKDMEVLNRYKKELICPICQEELENKDYKINRRTFHLVLIAIITSFIMGVII